MKLKLALEDKLMDTRLVDRFMAEGKLTKADYDKYLSSLDDCEGQYEVVSDKRAHVDSDEE
ncbi:MAG: hypothetical protein CME62_01875 [Halobacteriovoraceae bacterium]|nr:hypothetical protein [Halobacteriovoraceae bacterium]|tara:strand:+ start:14231 stop:14413 length:183 start_codon:yes stop_codon:yes gene_type:complete